MHRLFWIFLLCALPVQADTVKIWNKAVPFAPFENTSVKLLSVEELSAEDDRFGGLSALLWQAGRFWSVSDRGKLFRFNADFSDEVTVVALRDKTGEPLSGKRQTDSESLALAEGGHFYVAFERKHRVAVYDKQGYRHGKKLSLPKEVAELKDNGGLEAIEQDGNGILFLLAEAKNNPVGSPLWRGRQTWKQTVLAKTEDYHPTGLSRIAGCEGFILLERFYHPIKGVRARLSLLDGRTGERRKVIAQLGPPTPLDNFEGIATYRDKKGQLIVTLISDDNFSILQRTLVMKLLLKEKQDQTQKAAPFSRCSFL